MARRALILLWSAGTLIVAAALFSPALAQTSTATPSPAPDSGVTGLAGASTNVLSWLTGLAETYAGQPLLTTIAGILLVVLIALTLYFWIRRPKKPLETRAPM